MKSSCDSCMYYCYDEEFDEYFCEVNMDEDDIVQLLSDVTIECRYYRLEDEYKIVRKQMQILNEF